MTAAVLSGLFLLLVHTLCAAEAQGECKCEGPSAPCWPSTKAWRTLNSTIHGQLILNEPLAAPCYTGPEESEVECSIVRAQYTNTTFVQLSPVGYSYPLLSRCPLVSEDVPISECELGGAPVYTVNATDAGQIAAGIRFARQHNLRLVIRNTGHDLLGRSTGHGSLQIWIKYLRTGITFHEKFVQVAGEWEGAAVTIGGGYVWQDVYPEAAKRGLIVVGGGTPTVSCLGGWMQGGGHSPATHDYGIGADQVLEAKVVLADGSVVTASPFEHQDLFFAIRGGGPGTYGIVIETTVKAWPTTNVTAQTLAFAPLSRSDRPAFMAALTDLYQQLPELAQAGWSGYGQWTTAGTAPVFANFTTGYSHAFALFGRSTADGQTAFEPILAKLRAYNGTQLAVFISYTELSTYADFYSTFSGTQSPAGSLGSTSGRFLDEKALSNREALSQALDMVAGTQDQQTMNIVEFFGAPYGQIVVDGKAQPVSGLNPAWRSMIMHQIVARSWSQSTSHDTIANIENDVVFVKEAALKKLAPDTGSYMNEANRLDPDYKVDFYGDHYDRLYRIKRVYDPDDVFYCPTCVGSDRWRETDDGVLCRVHSGCQ